jgi:catechol 2,3-dioxygenase-like lactoylglutathione lyase family enzyme
MAIVIDHTIVPAQDMKESADFYAKIFGFEDLRREPGSHLHPIRVNDSTVLFLMSTSESDSPLVRGKIHLAFQMDALTFDEVFKRIQSVGIPYGDGPFDLENMREPGRTSPGARGDGKSIYFRDPGDNFLQIMTY